LVRLLASLDKVKRTEREAGGIVSVQGAPMLAGFDRALN
jgi:hypothetical protein